MIAEIIMNSSVKNLDRTFDYNIPSEMEDKIHIGSRVLVKFGNIKELKEGFVVNIKEKSEFKVKDISKVEEKDFIDEPKVKGKKNKDYNFSDEETQDLPTSKRDYDNER